MSALPNLLMWLQIFIPDQYIRMAGKSAMGFSPVPENRIEAGIEKLARLVEQV
ncbi:hypothetical protein [Candidatus Spongiihabitans sp.]|uniref:hypothetical protein n=1 Tax=Candidatus Spongiihabitans sp. TaxID=3101308 RepID=UPI003C7052E4